MRKPLSAILRTKIFTIVVWFGFLMSVHAQNSVIVSGTVGSSNLSFSGGGTLVLNGTSSYSGSVAISSGTLVVGSGSIATTGNGTLTLGSGALSLGSGALTIGSGTPGPGTSSVALSSGTVTLSDGTTISVNSGDYLLLNTGSIQVGTSNLTVGTGGTGAFGEITGGLVATQITSLNFPTNLTFDLNATLTLPINTSTRTSANINVPGNVTLNNTRLTLNDLATTPQKLAAGTTFNLIQYSGTEVGEFSINGTSISDGGTFQFGSNTFQLSYAVGDPAVEIMVVPEPSAWDMTLAGFGLLIFFRRVRLRSTARE